MTDYTKLKTGAPEMPFPEIRRAHADVHNSLVVVGDPKNPNAVAYAKAFNHNFQALEDGGEMMPLPPVNFDVAALTLDVRDDKGISHHFRNLEDATDGLRVQIKSGMDMNAHMQGLRREFMDAYHQAMDTAPDHFASRLKGNHQYSVKTNEGTVVVNADNPAAVAWAHQLERVVKKDGSVNPEDVPKITFNKADAELQPPAGSSAATQKEYYAVNTMFQQGTVALSAQYRASHPAAGHAAAAQTAARPSLGAHHP